MTRQKIRIIPLGGLGEIGKNMTAIEYGDEILIIDAGMMFPEDDMLGVDLLIPDITYLVEHKAKIKGIVITHGHEDHIGALPYILPQMDLPIYATKLTQGLISVKLKEHRSLIKTRLKLITPGIKFQVGSFKIEAFPVCHSIPDAVGLIIYTPLGAIVSSGDFKIDYTPIDNRPTDLSKLAKLGNEGVLLLMADSTYAEREGYTPTERTVGHRLDQIISEAPGRVIIATFSSLISRIQMVIDAAANHDRHVFIVGRSMKETVKMAMELGYLKAPAGILCNIEDLKKYKHEQIVLITTGSQGEPTSALVRIANRDHPEIRIMHKDTVVLSATPIPGNEALVNRTIDSLFRQGANVIYGERSNVHVHGHGSQEELKMLINLVKPKFFAPIHGEYRHLVIHAKLAKSVGIPENNVFVMDNGNILEIDGEKGRITGKVPYGNVYVDGLVLGHHAHVILRDRRALSRDGIVVVIVAIDKKDGKLVGKPDIVSRGFVDVEHDGSVIEAGKEIVASTLSKGHHIDHTSIQAMVKEHLSKFFFEKTKRRPMIITTAIEV
ncbi:MAG: ribonuclease J [Dehalococcoidia bacterium]|nr:MAG: ribonuclease J [Dehalococcoidia bacterium]